MTSSTTTTTTIEAKQSLIRKYEISDAMERMRMTYKNNNNK